MGRGEHGTARAAASRGSDRRNADRRRSGFGGRAAGEHMMMGRRGKDGPMRTCLGCRQRRPKGELVRLVRRPDGRVAADRLGPGRGAYVCADTGCVDRVLRGGRLNAALRGACVAEPELAAVVNTMRRDPGR
ncbi:MAG: YlxR family protein [Alphaproteobacteria bacterium]